MGLYLTALAIVTLTVAGAYAARHAAHQTAMRDHLPDAFRDPHSTARDRLTALLEQWTAPDQAEWSASLLALADAGVSAGEAMRRFADTMSRLSDATRHTIRVQQERAARAAADAQDAAILGRLPYDTARQTAMLNRHLHQVADRHPGMGHTVRPATPADRRAQATFDASYATPARVRAAYHRAVVARVQGTGYTGRPYLREVLRLAGVVDPVALTRIASAAL